MDEGLERLRNFGFAMIGFALHVTATVTIGVAMLGVLCAGKFFLHYLLG